MDLTRKQVIEILEQFCNSLDMLSENKLMQALDYAISSLKTDEAYQIMYEGGEVFTVDEVIDMLEKLKNLIENLPSYRNYITDGVSTYGYTEREPSAKDAVKHIQAKINALRGEEDESC